VHRRNQSATTFITHHQQWLVFGEFLSELWWFPAGGAVIFSYV
jgi:hypothetical protein